jgi:hypothetical protein
VRGTGPQCCDDLFQHTIDVFEYVVIPEAEHEISGCFECLGAPGIGVCANGVLSAVNFDNEVRIGAEEVDNVSGDRHLALEFPTVESAIAHVKPQCAFRISRITA